MMKLPASAVLGLVAIPSTVVTDSAERDRDCLRRATASSVAANRNTRLAQALVVFVILVASLAAAPSVRPAVLMPPALDAR